jgi:hypothetical protein
LQGAGDPDAVCADRDPQNRPADVNRRYDPIGQGINPVNDSSAYAGCDPNASVPDRDLAVLAGVGGSDPGNDATGRPIQPADRPDPRDP